LPWAELTFDDAGVASNLSNVIIDLMLIFTGKSLGVGALVRSAYSFLAWWAASAGALQRFVRGPDAR
jgi:hypothetical protein